MSDEPAVRLETRGGVATITLNRPEQRNALNTRVCIELLAAARSANADDSVRVVIVRGAGTVFCAGADLKERSTMTPDEVRARRLRAFAAYDALENITKPCIAVVHGPAVGSGCEIATSCDFVIAGDRASFRYPEALRGTIGATQRLPRIVGRALALELLYTGRAVSAEEALRIGLVNRVIPHEDLDTAVDELTTSIAAAPPLAMRLTKRAMRQGSNTDAAGALAIELMAIEEALAADEWRTGADEFARDAQRRRE